MSNTPLNWQIFDENDQDDDDDALQDDDRFSNHRAPDDSPRLYELEADDFPTYFSERDGRLFHSSPAAAYPLPADTPEQERMNVQHAILRLVLGANYVGPVPEILYHSTLRQPKLVLDLCTGTGKWVMGMAQEFPDVLFRGVDIVPIATRYPPSNVRFEVHDVNTGLRWDDQSIDFVHARSVSMAVNNYQSTLLEVARVLKSGGLFMSGEWGRYAAFDPSIGLDAAQYASASSHFFEVVNVALRERGIIPHIAGNVPAMLANTRLFHTITPQVEYVPIGPWSRDPEMKRLGRAFRAALIRYANSVKPLLRDAGWSDEQVERITSDYIHELRTVRGLVSVYYTVHARRL